MKAIDFSVLEDGEQFEELCEDLFKAMGYIDPLPERSGRGPDGGRDLIVTEHRKSGILGAPRRFRWLVECKSFAKSNKSVQPADVGSITDKLLLHNADGYLLVTSTVPSANVEATIKAINLDERLGFEATYWAKPRLIDELLKHREVYAKYFGSPAAKAAVLTHWSKHNPFLELFPYQEVQAKYFFGREAEIRELAEGLYRDNLVLVYGESGVGKTSLIQAGVLPLLRQEGFRVVSITVGSRFNIENLLHAVQKVVQDVPGLGHRLDFDESVAPTEVFQEVAEALCTHDEQLIVVLDQFEALFQSSPEVPAELGHTFPAMLSVARKYHSVAFLFSARADYLNEIGIWVDEYRIPEIWRNSRPIQKLARFQTIQVLHGVPAFVSAGFSDEVVETITSDLQRLDGGRVYPPNLQIVASRVFERARLQTNPQEEKLAIGLTDYEAVGGTEGVLASFLDEKLGEFGEDRDWAHRVLLALVSATGKRQSLSIEELSERLCQPAPRLRTFIDNLIGARLVRPVEQAGLYELVHDVLAMKVLEATEEEQRKAKAALEAFELAVNTWRTDYVLESAQKLDLYYEHRHSLHIGEEELAFLLLSESQGQDSFPHLFSRPFTHEKRLRWVNLATRSVCTNTLDYLLHHYAAVQKKRDASSRDDMLFEGLFRSLHSPTQEQTGVETLADLCAASSFEVQKELVAELERVEAGPMRAILHQAYQVSPIPTPASLSYLQDVVCNDLPSSMQQTIAFRILNHYLSEFPVRSWSNLQSAIESRIEKWSNQFPQALLANPVFRNMTFDYLKDLSEPTRRSDRMVRERFLNFRIELFKLLHQHDPDGTIKTMWDIVNATPYISRVDTAILGLLRTYDPEKTVDEVVRLVENHPLHYVDLLESMRASETDALLIEKLDEFVRRYKKGSKMWYGGGASYDRKRIREVVKAVGRRRLRVAVPHLTAIAGRYERQNLKLDCMDALVSIGGEEIVGIFVDLLNDGFLKVRNKASKYLCEMNQQRMVAKKIVESIRGQKEQKHRHKAKRSDAMRRKINTLCRLQAIEAIEILESVALNDSDESVRKTAARAVKALRTTS